MITCWKPLLLINAFIKQRPDPQNPTRPLLFLARCVVCGHTFEADGNRYIYIYIINPKP